MKNKAFEAGTSAAGSRGDVMAIVIMSSVLGTGVAAAADPLAFNNTVYPTPDEWDQKLRASNYQYPAAPVQPSWTPGAGLEIGPSGLDQTTAPLYAKAVKGFLEKHGIDALINTPHQWDPRVEGWYDMPWGGEGSPQADGTTNPETGREPIQGAYAGQIIQASTFYDDAPPNVTSFQNHSVVYYNDVAGAMLGKLWANPLNPDLSALQSGFPEGSVVVKVEGAAVEDWDFLKGSTASYVYRPPAAQVEYAKSNHPQGLMRAELVKMYFAQMAVKIKDPVASPETGWVFLGFTYDATGSGTTWDKVVAVGATWGNDPGCTGRFDGRCEDGQPVQETWVNPGAPPLAQDSLGWGGRLAAPMDVAARHNVVTVDGTHYSGNPPDRFPASACMSCHGAAQYPFIANLYPSPNMVFPDDGQTFLFFTPGGNDWAKWFQNRPGTQAMSSKNRDGIFALDYDMMTTLALMSALSGAGEDAFLDNLNVGH